MTRARQFWPAFALATLPALLPAAPLSAQGFSFEDILSPPYPVEMASARNVDRIAWISYELGIRNVFTAMGPDFRPIQLTHWTEDDGWDMTDIRISDDGEVVVFVRGHSPNGQGWVANPNHDPRGAEKAIWAIGRRRRGALEGGRGERPGPLPRWRLGPLRREGQIYRAPVNTGTSLTERTDDLPPLFRAWGENAIPVWSPDGRYIAFVSDRDDHSFIGVYDTRTTFRPVPRPGRGPGHLPGLVARRDADIAFIRRPGASHSALPVPAVLKTWHRRFPSAGARGGTFAGRIRPLHLGGRAGVRRGHRRSGTTPPETRPSPASAISCGPATTSSSRPSPETGGTTFQCPHPGRDGDPTELTPGEGFVEHVALSKDGRTLYYAGNMGDIHRRDLFAVSSQRRADPRQLTGGPMLETYPASLASDDQVALFLAGPDLPQSVAVVPVRGW